MMRIRKMAESKLYALVDRGIESGPALSFWAWVISTASVLGCFFTGHQWWVDLYDWEPQCAHCGAKTNGFPTVPGILGWILGILQVDGGEWFACFEPDWADGSSWHDRESERRGIPW